MQRALAVRAPALTKAEAAMLPALTGETPPRLPNNLRLPDRRTYIPVQSGGSIVEPCTAPPKETCRAALHHITAQRAGWRR